MPGRLPPGWTTAVATRWAMALLPAAPEARRRKKELDLQLAMMANDAYESEKTGATGTQSERELKKAGW